MPYLFPSVHHPPKHETDNGARQSTDLRRQRHVCRKTHADPNRQAPNRTCQNKEPSFIFRITMPYTLLHPVIHVDLGGHGGRPPRPRRPRPPLRTPLGQRDPVTAASEPPPSLSSSGVANRPPRPSLPLPHCPDPHRLSHDLQCLLAAVLERDARRRPRQRADHVRYEHLARRRQPANAGRDVDGTAVDVVVLADDVAGVDAEAKAAAVAVTKKPTRSSMFFPSINPGPAPRARRSTPGD
jgi:hypothetical protein